MRLAESDEPDSTVAFSLWKIPGRKSLLHTGIDLSLIARINQLPLRLLLTPQIQDGSAFSFRIAASADLPAAWAAVSHVRALLGSQRSRAPVTAVRRPTRQALVHARSLQALDGEAAGASHRDIAAMIFGRNEVWQRWATNSELRAQLRYLLRRGHDHVQGGYRRLLRGIRPSQRSGDLPTPLDSP